MYLGHVVEVGETEPLFETPRHPYTQALLSSVLAPDPAARGKLRLLQGEIPSPVNLPPICPFASRCPVVSDRGRVENPPLLEVDTRHFAACFRAHEHRGEFIDWFEVAAARSPGDTTMPTGADEAGTSDSELARRVP